MTGGGGGGERARPPPASRASEAAPARSRGPQRRRGCRPCPGAAARRLRGRRGERAFRNRPRLCRRCRSRPLLLSTTCPASPCGASAKRKTSTSWPAARTRGRPRSARRRQRASRRRRCPGGGRGARGASSAGAAAWRSTTETTERKQRRLRLPLLLRVARRERRRRRAQSSARCAAAPPPSPAPPPPPLAPPKSALRTARRVSSSSRGAIASAFASTGIVGTSSDSARKAARSRGPGRACGGRQKQHASNRSDAGCCFMRLRRRGEASAASAHA
jgi:hypothetical protein